MASFDTTSVLASPSAAHGEESPCIDQTTPRNDDATASQDETLGDKDAISNENVAITENEEGEPALVGGAAPSGDRTMDNVDALQVPKTSFIDELIGNDFLTEKLRACIGSMADPVDELDL